MNPSASSPDAAIYRQHVLDHFTVGARVRRLAEEQCTESILAASNLIADTFRTGHKLLLCGNGGSAADCQHMAAEFTSRLTRDFERPGLPAIALTTDTSFLTAFANDITFDGVFERQVQAIGTAGDTLLGISTSGSSKNVVLAARFARGHGMKIVSLTGNTGILRDLSDVCIAVPSDSTQHIQETHLAVEHLICHIVERLLFPAQT